MMHLEVFQTVSEAASRMTDLLAAQLAERPGSVLGLATGATPIPVYREIVARVKAGKMNDLSHATTFNLDEYVGLDGHDPHSFTAFMRYQLFDQLQLGPERTWMPPATGEDLTTRVMAYDDQIQQAGGIDWQLLGIGRNGHIGFNEPGTPLDSHTHITDLTESTREANAPWFGDDVRQVPRQAVTMGLGTIMRSGTIVLAAFGENKAAALQRAFAGEITPGVPASVLQRHRRVIVIADYLAAELLQTVITRKS